MVPQIKKNEKFDAFNFKSERDKVLLEDVPVSKPRGSASKNANLVNSAPISFREFVKSTKEVPVLSPLRDDPQNKNDDLFIVSRNCRESRHANATRSGFNSVSPDGE